MIGWFVGFGRERRLRALAREASAWLANDPESNDETRTAFAAWLLRSPQHVQMWLEMTAFDEEAGQRLGFPPYGSIVAAVNETNGRMTPRSLAPATTFSVRWQRMLPACGAALLVLGAGAVALAWSRYREPEHYAAALGEHRTLALEDGSTLQINTQSRVDVAFSTKSRQVRLLSGEAMFDVFHDVTRPFDVHAACGSFRALGTSFMVRQVSSERCELWVTSGIVQVSRLHRGRSSNVVALVGAGKQADVGPTGIALREVSEHEVTRRLAWLRGQLWFENETLGEAVAQFNRYNRDELVIDDPRLAAMRVGGAFRATDVDRFVVALDEVFGIRSEIVRSGVDSGAEIHLTWRGERSASEGQASR